MVLIFLSPQSVIVLRNIIKIKRRLELLPFMHIYGYRQTVNVDITNSVGLGHNTLISVGGEDRSRSLIISSSIEEYLEDHL